MAEKMDEIALDRSSAAALFLFLVLFISGCEKEAAPKTFSEPLREKVSSADNFTFTFPAGFILEDDGMFTGIKLTCAKKKAVMTLSDTELSEQDLTYEEFSRYAEKYTEELRENSEIFDRKNGIAGGYPMICILSREKGNEKFLVSSYLISAAGRVHILTGICPAEDRKLMNEFQKTAESCIMEKHEAENE